MGRASHDGSAVSIYRTSLRPLFLCSSSARLVGQATTDMQRVDCCKLTDCRGQGQRVHPADNSAFSTRSLSFQVRGLCGPIVASAPRRVAKWQHRNQDRRTVQRRMRNYASDTRCTIARAAKYAVSIFLIIHEEFGAVRARMRRLRGNFPSRTRSSCDSRSFRQNLGTSSGQSSHFYFGRPK